MREGCKGTQVFALDPSGTAPAAGSVGRCGREVLAPPPEHLKVNSIRQNRLGISINNVQINNTTVLAEALAAYGLPQSDLLEPQIEPCLKSVNFVETLADLYRRIENCPQFEKSGLYLEQCATFRGLSDPKLFRRSLQSARLHAVNVHSKIVLSAWLREDTKEDSDAEFSMGDDECSTSEEDGDISFCIGDDEVRCIRYNIASLSRPFKAMLCGGFWNRGGKD
ncbi:Ethylene-overproduction protein 1 [Camellia lanceoleosa]|uniref:Ethylene-overproduction protein 1 n=1 Tax=Camellia lanceoleosa TaxID=1840588 RepID=A0ACC0HSI3_9ERIC|nr:Ethylene-overproduction protein 1 [Camellia lanceoleosa]